MFKRADLLKTPTSARVSALFASSPQRPPSSFSSSSSKCVWSIYSSASTSALPHSIFSAPLPPLSTLYSLRVYISFTGESLRLSRCPYFCCGWCRPLFPAFYHLNISPPPPPPNSSFISLHPLYPLLSYRSALLCPKISNIKAEN